VGSARPRAVLSPAALLLVTTVLAGCSGNSPSTLDPGGYGARRVAGLWWLLFGIAAAVCVVITALVLLALRRRGADVRPRPGGTRVVVVAGVALPAVVLTAVYLVGLRDMRALQRPSGPAGVTVDVTGHLWWWQVGYPDRGLVTANEIHVPVGQVVHLRLRTADVNHSFWVPQLMPKTDLVAGRVNDTWIRAERPGTFRGQCAEFCGLQHAHMALAVVAEGSQAFEAWVAQQSGDAPVAATALQRRGKRVLESSSCAACHTVRGTTAHGSVGPDLTHLATRSALGAGTVPNVPGHLAGWIANSQAVKPGNKMPPQPLSPDDLRAVVAYLDAGKDAPSPGGPAGPQRSGGGTGPATSSSAPSPGASSATSSTPVPSGAGGGP